MTSEAFVAEAVQNKSGTSVGLRSIWFNGKHTKEHKEHIKERYQRYIAQDFSRLAKGIAPHDSWGILKPTFELLSRRRLG